MRLAPPSLLALAALSGNGWTQTPPEPPPAPPVAETSLLKLKRQDFAAAPLVSHPVAIDVDEFGRVFVAETHRLDHRGVILTRGRERRVLDDLQTETLDDRERFADAWLASGELDENLKQRTTEFPDPAEAKKNFFTKFSEKVALLVDRNNDGIADQRADFATGFNEPLDGLAAGILTWSGKVWFACTPNLWLLHDANFDLKADAKEALATGFGIRQSWLGHDCHGLVLGIDGRLYFSMGDRGFSVRTKEGRVFHGPNTGGVFRCWPDGSDLELVCRGLRNPQELACDDFGNLFTGDNNCDAGDKARIEWIVDGADYGWEMNVQDLPHRGPWMREHLWETRLGKSEVAYPAWRFPPLAHLGAGPAGFAAYPGSGLPHSYQNHFFLCDFRGGGNGTIHAFGLADAGAGFSLTNIHAIENGVGVCDVAFGWDGRLYVADWGNSWDLNDKGRIYTLTHEESAQSPVVAAVKKLAAEDFSKRSVIDLCRLIEHPDRRIRLKAQFALAEKGAPDTLEKVLPVIRKAQSVPAKIHALWAVAMMARKTPVMLSELIPYLKSEAPELRANAARVFGVGRYAPASEVLAQALKDPHPRVRMQAALALGRIRSPEAMPVLLQALAENDDEDAWLRHGLVMGLAGCATPTQITALTREHPSRAVRLGAVLALRKLAASEVAEFLQDHDAQIVTEAARAIYDLNLVPAMPGLAAALDRLEFPEKLRNEGFLRRALEACLRLGRREDAEIVARFAAMPKKSGISDDWRLVALRALERWDAPPPREEVWHRWQPVPSRTGGLAAAALQKYLPDILKNCGGDALAKARELDRTYGKPKSPAEMRDLVKNESLAENIRLGYLHSLEEHKDAGAMLLEASHAVLLSPNFPKLRTEARKILARKEPQNAFALWSEALVSGSTPEKQAAVTAFAKMRSTDAEKKLLELGQSLADGLLDAGIEVEVLEAVHHRDAKRTPWRKILEKYEARVDLANNPLALYRGALEGGDVAAGREIFFGHQLAQCLRCHAIRGQGGMLGPDLHGIAAKLSAAELLAALVTPSSRVADGYGVVTVTLKDDKTLSGLLQGKSDDKIFLLEGTTPREIALGDVKEISAPLSAMPPMGALLTKREIRDVMAFLLTLKQG